MFANLVAFNNAGRGKVTEASVEYNAFDQEEVIQLTIGTHMYQFNSMGELLSSSENQSNFSLGMKANCASLPDNSNCISSSKYTPYN